jgi:septum formation protein
MAPKPLLLASQSTVRQDLLKAAGIPIEVQAADLDERAAEQHASSPEPGSIASLLAREKASMVERLQPGRLVVGADQVLALGRQRFSKPADRAAARAQLVALRGQTHELHSAVAVVQNTTVLFEHIGIARLTMRAFSDRFLELYLDRVGAAATTSVGAYQLEGAGIQLFDRVEGDYFTVLGLPLFPLLDFLRRHGCLLP